MKWTAWFEVLWHSHQGNILILWSHEVSCNSNVTETHHDRYNDFIMSAMASQITSLTIVYSTVYSRRRSKKTPKLHVTGLCAGNSPVIGEFPHKGPVTRKMFPFDDVIMCNAFWMLAVSSLADDWQSEGITLYYDHKFSILQMHRIPLRLGTCINASVMNKDFLRTLKLRNFFRCQALWSW